MSPTAPPGLTRRLKLQASAVITTLFGASCRHRASNQRGLKTEAATCEAVRPSEGGCGDFLRTSSLTPAVLDGYRRLVAAFLLYCCWLNLALTCNEEIDCALCKWADEQYCDQVGPASGERLLSAFCALYPEHRPGNFPYYLRALRGWRRLRPKGSRHPLPWPFLVSIAFYVHSRTPGGFEAFVGLLLLFDCYLRPYELLQLRLKDVVAPTLTVWHWTLSLCPFEELRPTKTRTFDDSVALDSTWRPEVAFFVEVLLVRARRRGLCGEDRLFSFSYVQLAGWFSAGAAWLGLSSWGFTLYSGRHGGPSEDFVGERRSLAVIQRRGRWASEASLRRYQQTVRLQLVYARTPPELVKHCVATLAHIYRLIEEGTLLEQPCIAPYDVPAAEPLPEEEPQA